MNRLKRSHQPQGAKHPLALDATTSPPVPCDLKLGDVVTFTNDFGVAFSDLKVTGFTPCVEGHGRFVYLDKDSWWFPVKPDQLRLQ